MQAYPRRQIFIASIVCLGQMSVGYTMGWPAPTIPKLQDPLQTPLPDVITDEQSSWVGSLLFIGTITGLFPSSYISNAKGRKSCFLLGAAISTVSFLIMAFANSIAMIYAARTLMGLGISLIFVTNLVYVGEIASTHTRGVFLTLVSAVHTVGTVVVYSVGPYTSYAVTCWVGFTISATFMIAIFFIPESPIFQMLDGQENEAKANLKSLGRENDIEMVKAIVKDITNSSMAKNSEELFTIKSNRRAFIISLSLNLFQQTSGIVPITFFATGIFELAGSSVEPHIATIIIGVTLMCSGGLAPFLIERAGRKSLMLYSSAFGSLSLTVLGLYFFLDRIDHSSLVNIAWVPLLSLVTFCLFYDIGLGVIPSTLTGEMFRANVRSVGSGISYTITMAAAFTISTTFGYMVSALGPDFTFWIFALCTLFAFIFTIFFVPETKGKTLLEIEEILSK